MVMMIKQRFGKFYIISLKKNNPEKRQIVVFSEDTCHLVRRVHPNFTIQHLTALHDEISGKWFPVFKEHNQDGQEVLST